MLNPALVLETALLILAAFLIGATIGTLAKTAFLRVSRKLTPGVVDVPAAATDAQAEPALITAPIIGPLNKPASPTAPSDVPVPDFASIVQSIAKGPDLAGIPALEPLPHAIAVEEVATVMAPARVAGQTTSGRLIAAPRTPAPTGALPTAMPESADVIPFPAERASMPVPVDEPAEATEAEQPNINGLQGVAEEAPIEPALLSVGPPSVEQSSTIEGVAVPLDAEPAVDAPAVVETKGQVNQQSRAEHDETAAMRAIEGNWSPKRRSNRRKASPSPAPDVADVDLATDSGVAAPEAANGRPGGLPAPRGGVKDNLTNIIGVLPIIETALNSAGVFHFDQVADFTDDNVAWLEGHLGISGRVAREQWREQARELAASDRARKVASQP